MAERAPLFCDHAWRIEVHGEPRRPADLHRGPFRCLSQQLGETFVQLGSRCLACGQTVSEQVERQIAAASLANRSRTPPRYVLPAYDPYTGVFRDRS